MFSKGVSTRSCFVHGHPLVEWEGATWEVMAFNVGELHYFEEDQEAIDETNYEVVTDEIGSDYATWSLIMDLNYRRVNRHDYDGSQDALYVTSPHGFFGSIDQFHELSQSQWMIKVGSELHERIADLRSAEEYYPLLDEDAYSARENEAWAEYAMDGLRMDTVNELRRQGMPDDEIDLIDERWGDVLGRWYDAAHYWSGFTGEHYPKLPTWIMDNLAEVTALVNQGE